MNTRIVTLALAFATLAAHANASPPLPETDSLQSELAATKATLMSLSARTSRVEKKTETARKAVEQASKVVRDVDQIDDLLLRVIRELEPVSKLPPTRTMKPVVVNLKKLQTEFHKIRVKGDKVQKKVLAPTRSRLSSMEHALEKAIIDLDQAARDTEQARGHIGKLRDFVATSNVQAEADALESAAKTMRAALRPVQTGLKAVDSASGDVERDLNDLTHALAPLNAAGPGLDKLQRDLRPVNDTARELDKVLNQRIAVKVLGKSVGFTVRQVIEGPGNVADIFLRPLEKLAEQALAPITRKVHLEIPLPRDVQAISQSLDAVEAQLSSMTASATRLETALQNTGVAPLRTAMGTLNAKTTSQLSKR